MAIDREYLFNFFRMLWAEEFGVERPIQPHERMHQWLKDEGFWNDSLDITDVFCHMEKAFGDQVSYEELMQLFTGGRETFEDWERDIAPELTFSIFVDLIARKNPDPAKFNRRLAQTRSDNTQAVTDD